MNSFIMLIVLVVADRYAPVLMRLYGVGLFPLTNKLEVQSFNKKYGLVAFPRTVFLVLAVICAAVAENSPQIKVEAGLTMIVFIVGWGVSSAVDVWKARKSD